MVNGVRVNFLQLYIYKKVLKAATKVLTSIVLVCLWKIILSICVYVLFLTPPPLCICVYCLDLLLCKSGAPTSKTISVMAILVLHSKYIPCATTLISLCMYFLHVLPCKIMYVLCAYVFSPVHNMAITKPDNLTIFFFKCRKYPPLSDLM